METLVKAGMSLLVSTAAKEVTKHVVDTYIKPNLEKSYKNNESSKKFLFLEDKFQEYMERTYNNNLYMSTIVFKNQQKIINDLYIPLTVVKCRSNDNEEYKKIKIDRYGDEFVKKYKKVLLVDNAGMGKSTIMKYLYLRAITENAGIPILIELRKLKSSISILDFIMNEINGIKQYFNKDEVIDLIEGGGFIFFFDGYDEIRDECKKEITEELQDFISKTSISKEDNSFIISSRDENSLSCFCDFQRFDIEPLTENEAYSLIYKYDNYGEISKELVKNLENEENLKIVSEFLSNPLMVSLLYKAFCHKKVVPHKKHIFYSQVYNALFEDHDRTKGGAYVHYKRSELDIDDFNRILRILGFITLSRGISYSKESLIEFVRNAKKISGVIEFRENDFIHDIVHSVPIFLKEGNEYRWIHKSFQEYFAASYICYDAKEKSKEYLLEMIKKDKINKYYNILDFCYDIDYKEFRNTIIYPIIKEFIEYYNNSYVNEKYKEYKPIEIEIRKNINFIYNEIYIKFISETQPQFEPVTKNDLIKKLKVLIREWKYVDNRYTEVWRSTTILNTIITGFHHQNKNIRLLIDFLSNKENSIIKKIPITNNYRNELGQYFEQKIGDEFIINKEKEDILIDKDIISQINAHLLDINRSGKCCMDRKIYIFDYNECINLKEKVESEYKYNEDMFIL